MKLVIVEDEVRIREGLARLIRKLRPDCEIAGEAENGALGLELIRRERPQLVITDIRMPVMDGLEMLRTAFAEGLCAKAIVLSAYSEFEYARQAMRMGVKEYLVKPIVVGDVSESLRRVGEELEAERRQAETTYESAEQILSGILSGSLEADEQMERRLETHYGIPADTKYHWICVYLGDHFARQKGAAKRELERLLSGYKGLTYYVLELERERTLGIILYESGRDTGLERWVQYWLLQDGNRMGPVGFYADLGLDGIKDGLDTLLHWMDWSIPLGDGILISYPKVTRLQTSPCIYPLEIERRMKLAVCGGERRKVQESVEAFEAYFSKGALYAPREVKECCVRFWWAFINTGKEVGIQAYEGLEQQRLLERIMNARTSEELFSVGKFLLEGFADEDREVSHLTIKRVKGMIREFYQTGITLEEIASKLDLTPEYLGTVFHREMGMTFSAYMKNFRLKKAKELLIGTNLKQYEIAQRIGYTDPKYFSRVFKEATGQLPAEYRKTHK